MSDKVSQAFKRMYQKGWKKSTPNPTAFLELPRCLVDRFGFFSNRGVRLELAVLSGFMFYARKLEGAREVEFHKNGSVYSGEDVFLVSIETIAEDLYWRYFGVQDDRSGRFRRFYNRVWAAARRLMEAKLIHRTDKIGHEGLLGSHWKLREDLYELLPDLGRVPPPNGTVFDCIKAEEPEGDRVNVLDFIGHSLVSEDQEGYGKQEFTASVTRRRHVVNGLSAMRRVAKSQKPVERHISTGAFAEGKTGACMMPFVILDIDEDTPEESYEKATRILGTLALECDISRIDACYTGGRGFHLHIPSGMFGNPVFASAEECKKVLSAWANEYLGESLDVNLFSPRHLVRMTGSIHPATGLRKTAFRGDEFLKTPLHRIISASVAPRKYRIRNPYKAPREPDLMMSLAEIAFRRFYIPEMSEVELYGYNGVFKKAMEGCAEGDQWHERHVGRNKLVFVAACYLIHLNEDAAFNRLLEVNDRCDPPLPARQVQSCFNSAHKTILRENDGIRHRYRTAASA